MFVDLIYSAQNMMFRKLELIVTAGLASHGLALVVVEVNFPE
jgi:hypothetical protein